MRRDDSAVGLSPKPQYASYPAEPLSGKMRIILATSDKNNWSNGELNPGPFTCEANVIPLYHCPCSYRKYERDWNIKCPGRFPASEWHTCMMLFCPRGQIVGCYLCFKSGKNQWILYELELSISFQRLDT